MLTLLKQTECLSSMWNYSLSSHLGNHNQTYCNEPGSKVKGWSLWLCFRMRNKPQPENISTFRLQDRFEGQLPRCDS